MRVVIRAGGRVAIPVYNIYGFPGGHHDKEAASRTNAIVEAVVQEIAQRGDIYASIVGDLNADTCDLPAVTELLQTQGWTDLGAHPNGRRAARQSLRALWPAMRARGGT